MSDFNVVVRDSPIPTIILLSYTQGCEPVLVQLKLSRSAWRHVPYVILYSPDPGAVMPV